MRALVLLLLVPLALASLYAVVISNPNDVELRDYQVKLTLPSSLQGSYLVFIYSSTTIPYCFEAYGNCTTVPASAYVWIKVPYLPPHGEVTAYLTYGNKANVIGEVFDHRVALFAQNCCYGSGCENIYSLEKGDLVNDSLVYYIKNVIIAYEGDYDDPLEYAYVYLNGRLVGTLDGYLNTPQCFQGPLETTTYTVNGAYLYMTVAGNAEVNVHYEKVYVDGYFKKLAPTEPIAFITTPNNYVYVSVEPTTVTITWREPLARLTTVNSTEGLLLTLTNATCQPYGFTLFATYSDSVRTYPFGSLIYTLLNGTIMISVNPATVAIANVEPNAENFGILLKGVCTGSLYTIFLYTTSTYVTTTFVYTYTSTSTAVITYTVITTTTDSFGNIIYTTSEVTSTYYKLVTSYTTITTPTMLTLTLKKVLEAAPLNGFIERKAYHEVQLPTTITDTDLLLTPVTVIIEGSVTKYAPVPWYLLLLFIAAVISRIRISR